MFTEIHFNESYNQVLGTSSTWSLREDPVSDEARLIFQWVIYAILCEAVNIFGTVTNILNIICFVKQGMRDSVTVNFLGLAISDFGCLATLLVSNICLNPALQHMDLSFEPVEVQYMATAWPHVIFTRVTSWITAIVTLERCICISMPLKVKDVFTPRRSAIAMVVLYVLFICSVSPFYYANRLDWKFSVTRNRTIYGLVFASDRERVETICFAINIILPFIAFIAVIIFTVTLVVKLNRKRQWRERVIIPENAEVISGRDLKVARLVVSISAMFIACYSPMCLMFIIMIFIPGLSIGGRFHNSLTIIGGIGLLLESINSAMNIFIYYHMSSKYRLVFRQLFRLR